MTTDPSATATIRRTIVVEFDGDPDLLQSFLAWQMKHHTYPIPGTTTANGSTGYFFATFDADDEESVAAFFADRHVDVGNGRSDHA